MPQYVVCPSVSPSVCLWRSGTGLEYFENSFTAEYSLRLLLGASGWPQHGRSGPYVMLWHCYGAVPSWKTLATILMTEQSVLCSPDDLCVRLTLSSQHVDKLSRNFSLRRRPPPLYFTSQSVTTKCLKVETVAKESKLPLADCFHVDTIHLSVIMTFAKNKWSLKYCFVGI